MNNGTTASPVDVAYAQRAAAANINPWWLRITCGAVSGAVVAVVLASKLTAPGAIVAVFGNAV
jgi:hypothetical protein